MVHALVAGGGIGGLACALALARGGHRVTVLERRQELTEIGAGIQIAPNGFLALDRLGVGPAVRARGVHVEALRLVDGATGELLAGLPLTGEYRHRFRGGYAVVGRRDLYGPLLAACRAAPAVTLVTGASVADYTQGPGDVTVRTADGRAFRGDLLVGADGLWSAVRARLVDDGPPKPSGHTIHRALVPVERVPEHLRWNTVTLWAGTGRHLVHYLIDGGRHLNVALTVDDGAQELVSGRPVPREHVLDRLDGLHPLARNVAGLADAWREWVLCDRDPVATWTDGRVALLGDAAHPMLQYAAQGACQALEDAVVLGGLLNSAGPGAVPGLLAVYRDARWSRAGSAQLLAREMGDRLYHPSGALARSRDALLRSLSEEDLYAKVTWLHGARDFTGPGPAALTRELVGPPATAEGGRPVRATAGSGRLVP
ncbi:FAD-dependent monooxygenase [Streptomyces sp. NPDC052687]|uniref:FAD-dependent monooxygenase n=1 Tax=Streptomyces sp. NPDC052687 TaxID=3154759 RepID=UPI00341E97B9